MIEHKKFPKIPRIENTEVIITEKLDGTNACIYVNQEEQCLYVGSRNHWISWEDDQFGLFAFCELHKDVLLTLPTGYHYGEFCGPKIQGNRYNLPTKTLFLFDIRHDLAVFGCYSYIRTVPFIGKVSLSDIGNRLEIHKNMKSLLNNTVDAEGIMLYIESIGKYIKVIYKK